MRKLSKILVLVLVLMTVLTAVSAMTASALSVRISGSWNGWGTANNTTLVDNLYIHKVDLTAGTYEFKVVEGSTWMGNNSTFTNSTTNASFTTSGGNAKLKVTTAGTFIFQWNASTNKLTIVQHSAHTLEVAETPATCTVDGLKTEKCTVVGCGHNVETVLKAQGHTYADGVCTVCGEAEPTEHVHFFVSEVTKAPTCTEKGELTWTCACGEDSYTTEAEMLEHTYKFGACTACGGAKPGYTYYLEGYINNADYTGTKYAFVDGKLTISAFTAASYIYVVDSEGNRFMTSAYSTKTTDTFVTTGAEKMLIPTGFDELTFTIVNNKNGTVTLSYEGKSNCNHNWVDATCQKAKHCTVCGELDGAVINHYYWDGKCQWCDSTITEWVTVYVNNVANWDTVNFYAWSSTTTIGTYMAWPGTAMVENEDGLFVAQIPAQYENIIFNNGTVQSADLKVPTNSKVIFNNSANTWSCLHTWVDATCAAPKTCSGCGITDGEALAHTWVDATYSAPKTCSVCGATEGEALSLPGAGTEEDPFVIASLEALIAFRDSVNAGETKYNAEGVYVVLGADIDMSSVDWSVNIGDDCNATFDGIFDGKGHKILNLNATETAQKADGYVCSGLFGAIYGNAVIKNLTIENVSINTGDFTGNNVAAVVGFVYSGTGSIENVTVCGDIKIDANGVYGVGAIVGYSYYGSNLTIKDCKVVGNEGSYIKAVSGAGAIAGYAYGIHVVNAEVSGLTIEGAGLLGGLIGIAVNNSTDVNGAHVANVTLNATKDVWVNGTGIAVGTLSSNSIKIEGVTFENVTGADTLLGSAYAEKPETVVPAFVARIGDVYYTDIQEAIAAAQAGETVYVFAGTYALPSMKAGIAIEGVGEVLFEGTLSGTLENLTLKNIHIKGANAQRWAYAKGDLVFENVIFEATSIYALHFDGITEGATLLYKDCTIIGWAAMSGSPASCVFDGCTIKGNGSYGLIRTYFDATIQNCTFDVSNVNPDDVYQDGIHAVDATVTVNNCTNVNGEMKDIIDTSKVGYIVLDGETIHIHKYDVTETVAATCTTAGHTTYTCPCGHTYTEEVEALGHDIVVDSAAVDATCTEAGLTAAEHCSRCDYVKTQEEVAALGHTWEYATCTTPDTCSVCGLTEGEARGHADANPCDHECDWCGASVSDCLDENKNHNCDICGDVMSTCTDADKNHFCDICGVQNSHCIDIPPYDHNCDWCGEKMSEHTFEEGKCTVCGADDPNYVPPCAHKDTGLDAKCDVCGEYFLPTSPFKLEMYQASKKETYYFTGAMSGYYFATSTDITKAVDLYAEEVEGGYNVYFMSGSTKNYLYIELSGTHINAKFGSTKAVWYVDPTYGCLTTEVSGTKYFLGTYSSYVTFGGTAYSRLTASTADVSQYVGRAVSLENHECTNTTVTGETAPTCTAQGYTTYKCADCGLSTKGNYVAALGHTYENCVCTVCEAVLPTLSVGDAFDFTTEDGFNAALANGKIALVGEFRSNGDSYQFNTTSTMQFVVPANTTVTITGHSAQYGVFNVYLNGEKTVMTGALTFTVKEETKVVIATENASYSYIKGIAVAEFVDRTIVEDTTINFGSEGNYKESIVDFSGIQIGDNGGNNSQVKNGSFDLLLKAGTKVVIHGYPGYTSYKLNDGEPIEDEYYTYIALEDTVLTVTPASGNNYFYSIEITLHTGVALVEAKDATCTEAGHGAYYACECHGELTEKTEVAALGHKYEAAVTAPTCTEAGYTTYTCACGDTYTGDEVAALGHTFVYGKCAVCGAADPEYVPYVNTLVVGDTNKIVVDGDTFNDYNLPIEWVAFVADEKATYTFVGDNGALVFIFDAELNFLCGGTGTATLEAGTYLICIGNGLVGELNVAVTKTALPHEHVWSEATCTEPAKCECGETQGEALGHTFAEGLCTVCGAEDPDYVPEQPPVDEPTEEPKDEPTTEEPDALAKVWDMILKLLAWVMGFFKNLFVKA